MIRDELGKLVGKIDVNFTVGNTEDYELWPDYELYPIMLDVRFILVS